VRKTLPLFALLSVSAIAAACSSSSTGGSSDTPDTGAPSNGNSATLHAGSSVVPQSLADVAKVETDSIVFPASVAAQLTGYATGNILISNRASNGGSADNPNGFLRKITSISKTSTDITFNTTQVVLQQAVDSLKFESKIQMPQLTMTGPVGQSEGLHTLGGSSGSGSGSGTGISGGTNINLLNYSGTKLLNYTDSVTLPDGATLGFTAHATVTTGTLDFAPSWDIGGDLGFLTISDFHATASGKLTANLALDAGVTLNTTLTSAEFTALVAQAITKSTSTTIANYNVNLGTISAGPLSLPTSAQFTATLACQFAFGGGPDVTIGGTATGTATAGITYSDGSLTPSFSDSFTFTHTGPKYNDSGIIQAFCSVTPKFELQLFGVATADLSANAYAGAGGDLTCAGKQVTDAGLFKTDSGIAAGEVQGQLIAGVSATIDAQVNILGLYKWNKSCVLFNEYDNQNYSDTFTLPGGSGTTCSSTAKYHQIALPTVNGSACFGSTAGGDAGPVGKGNDAGGPDTGTTSGGKDAGKDSATGAKDSSTGGQDSSTGKDATTGTDGSIGKDATTDSKTGGGDSAVKDIADAAFEGSFDATDDVPDGHVITNEAGIIEGSCTHDICTAGIRLGEQCDECTYQVCKNDHYCCDTLWGPSCVDVDVPKYCGHTCN